MSSDLVPLDHRQAVLTGVSLSSPPPTRVYIDGHSYTLAAPRVPLPPLINMAKLVLNWVSINNNVAKNVLHVLTGGGFVTSDVSSLKALANGVLTILRASTPIPGLISDKWTLTGVTARDGGGTTASADSDGAAAPGTNAGAPQPPQVAICISWQVAESYRGGKPRTYLPGVPATAINGLGNSAITTAHATSLEAAATTFMNLVNTMTIAPPGTFKLGTVSYFTGHAVRPTPVFRQFINVKVHERLDSQRRRSGRESAFGVVP